MHLLLSMLAQTEIKVERSSYEEESKRPFVVVKLTGTVKQILISCLCWFILLYILFICYLALGAELFRWAEAENEKALSKQFMEYRKKFVLSIHSVMWDSVRNKNSHSTEDIHMSHGPHMNLDEPKSRLKTAAFVFLKESTDLISKTGFDPRFGPEQDTVPKWTFSGGLLHSAGLVTTVGFFNLAPSTDTGKLISIFYLIVGVPLYYLLLSNVGFLLSSCLTIIIKCVIPRWFGAKTQDTDPAPVIIAGPRMDFDGNVASINYTIRKLGPNDRTSHSQSTRSSNILKQGTNVAYLKTRETFCGCFSCSNEKNETGSGGGTDILSYRMSHDFPKFDQRAVKFNSPRETPGDSPTLTLRKPVPRNPPPSETDVSSLDDFIFKPQSKAKDGDSEKSSLLDSLRLPPPRHEDSKQVSFKVNLNPPSAKATESRLFLTPRQPSPNQVLTPRPPSPNQDTVEDVVNKINTPGGKPQRKYLVHTPAGYLTYLKTGNQIIHAGKTLPTFVDIKDTHSETLYMCHVDDCKLCDPLGDEEHLKWETLELYEYRKPEMLISIAVFIIYVGVSSTYLWATSTLDIIQSLYMCVATLSTNGPNGFDLPMTDYPRRFRTVEILVFIMIGMFLMVACIQPCHIPRSLLMFGNKVQQIVDLQAPMFIKHVRKKRKADKENFGTRYRIDHRLSGTPVQLDHAYTLQYLRQLERRSHLKQ